MRAPARAHWRLPDGAPAPVCWARATRKQTYLNFGDALSPVMVAALSGRPIQHAEFDGEGERIAAVGTIGHGLHNGVIWVWGTGSSDKDFAPRDRNTQLRVRATRGPVSWRLLTRHEPNRRAVYGDPVWLLPRFYNPPRTPKWDLGVIMHLSEHVDREPDLTNRPLHARYAIPDSLRGSVRLLDTITSVSADALRQRLDDILSCRRIVSTSLHGMVIAESYGIPCLYFPPRIRQQGLARIDMASEPGVNLRFTDLYLGLGQPVMPVYGQNRTTQTDWDDVIKAVDGAWEPKRFNAERLVRVFPLPVSPLRLEEGQDLFSSPIVRAIPFRAR